MDEIKYHQFKLRLPEDLWVRLETAAKSSSRSVSAELIHRLEESFAETRLNLDQLQAFVKIILERMDKSWPPKTVSKDSGNGPLDHLLEGEE